MNKEKTKNPKLKKIVSVHKFKLYPIGDKNEVNRIYKFIRDGQYAQYVGLNLLMGQLASKYYECNRDLNNINFIEFKKTKMTNSNPILSEIQFATGVDTPSLITQKVKQDFSAAIRNGLAKGERTITNYKRTNPLLTRNRNLKFYADDETDLNRIITDKNINVYLKWVNKIVFKVILGKADEIEDESNKRLKRNYNEQRATIKKILSGDLSVCGSSIEIVDKSIILNLSTETKEIINNDLNEDIVVGVDMGIKIPAMCSLNNDEYSRKAIGNIDDFLRVRTKVQAQKRQVQRNLKNSKGGHGRNKKLKALERFEDKEHNFATQYNHMISRNIIEFALKNNAKYINIENLTKEGFDDKILRNWSYYQLMKFIEYKAEKYGIVVRKVNPYHTSQNCSKCGHWEEGQRITQAKFKCLKCGYEENADFNASRNIAKSIEFIK